MHRKGYFVSFRESKKKKKKKEKENENENAV